MAIAIETQFSFRLPRTSDVLLQFEAAAIPEQTILSANTELSDSEHCARVAAQDDIGERIWLRAGGEFNVSYNAEVALDRQIADLGSLKRLMPHEMPGEAVQYLFDSRYCPADRFQTFVDDTFGNTDGGARIAAIRDWIGDNYQYTPGASGPQTGALDTFIERRGICRDYAHTLVALARASTIPARYVACYAPGVDPPDFHAVAEVFLNDPETEGGGTWQLVDATGMADPAQTVKIGVGRDAADVSFLTSFGANQFLSSSVRVRLLGE
ncbi:MULTISPECIES: transglutaminase-like domain-containing protein [Qipengyuania]|uniref:Transglutaminase family protein n=2 Tax=Qipengyuania TaxID=1855416 RepID=A0A9Q3RYW1_9SPHN|nr:MULTISPECIES: transglutaminase family protein [Qipengyuania]MBY6216991.1 transglutaminase family protein [Qipengyuania aquimaris]QZD92077.1 transglutaminase family protein [Qipengyuania xiapuensis]